jgi:formate/nitrite transporter FocA (FNT family)
MQGKSEDMERNEVSEDTKSVVDHIDEASETETAAEESQQKDTSSSLIPTLNDAERQDVANRVNPRASIVLETIRAEGEQELKRSGAALAVSALAAGLSMGFSLVAQGLLQTTLPVPFWGSLISNLGYSLGFVIVVLGRQQLFTENTLTAIVPLLAHPERSTLFQLLRLWTIVLVFNLIGALIFSTVIAHTALFSPQVQHSFVDIAQRSLHGNFGLTVLRGIFAGWLIALMVWLLPASNGMRLHIIILLTYIVALGGFAHIIAGSVDVLYLVNVGLASWLTYFGGFMVPTLIGNIIGGALLVALLNFGQVAAERITPRRNKNNGTVR